MTCSYFADLHNDIGTTSKQHGHEKKQEKIPDARVFADVISPFRCIDTINLEWAMRVYYTEHKNPMWMNKVDEMFVFNLKNR